MEARGEKINVSSDNRSEEEDDDDEDDDARIARFACVGILA